MRWQHRAALVAACALAFLAGCRVQAQDSAAASSVDAQITVLDPSVYPFGGVHHAMDVAEFQVKLYPAGSSNNATDEILGTDLTHNETFKCNGSDLSADHSGRYTFWGTTTQAAASASYACVYARDGVSTTVSIPALPRPRILVPAAPAVIVRTVNLPLGVALGQPGGAAVSLGHTQVTTLPAGTTHAVIPAAMLAQTPAGPGLLIVSQTVPVNASDSGFHSVTISETVAAYVPVTFN